MVSQARYYEADPEGKGRGPGQLLPIEIGSMTAPDSDRGL